MLAEQVGPEDVVLLGEEVELLVSLTKAGHGQPVSTTNAIVEHVICWVYWGGGITLSAIANCSNVGFRRRACLSGPASGHTNRPAVGSAVPSSSVTVTGMQSKADGRSTTSGWSSRMSAGRALSGAERVEVDAADLEVGTGPRRAGVVDGTP